MSRKGRDIHGFLLLDKPQGMTSNRALQRVKGLFGARKAGHTGSLDPLATGMLPICFGVATKVAQYGLAADKCYEVTGVLGTRTDTDDADGSVVEVRAVPELSPRNIEIVLSRYVGSSEQVPPMYSAIKHHGRRLYELARRGLEVARTPRPITIRRIELLSFETPALGIRVTCSKGTYVRALVTDIAAALGTVGHVSGLRRLSVDSFGEARMWTLEQLEDLAETGPEDLEGALLSTDSVLADWPELTLDADSVRRIRHGQTVRVTAAAVIGRHRIYSPGREFVGIGELNEAGELAPRRILG